MPWPQCELIEKGNIKHFDILGVCGNGQRKCVVPQTIDIFNSEAWQMVCVFVFFCLFVLSVRERESRRYKLVGHFQRMTSVQLNISQAFELREKLQKWVKHLKCDILSSSNRNL